MTGQMFYQGVMGGPRMAIRVAAILLAFVLAPAFGGRDAKAVDFSELKTAAENVTKGIQQVAPQTAGDTERVEQTVVNGLTTKLRSGEVKDVEHITGEWQEPKSKDDAMVDFLVCPE